MTWLDEFRRVIQEAKGTWKRVPERAFGLTSVQLFAQAVQEASVM